MDGPSYGSFTDPDGNPVVRRIPISYVAALPGAGDFPGHIFYLTSGSVGLYVWNGASFVGPLGTGGGGGGAPTTAQYVTMALDGTLTSERVLAAGAGLALADGGPNGNATLSVPAAGITRAMLADSAALSVIGRAVNSAGVPADIAATPSSEDVLKESGSMTLAFGKVGTNSLDANAVTFAKFQAVPSDVVIGRRDPGSGNIQHLFIQGGLESTSTPGIRRSALTGDVTAAAGSNATTIADQAVTFAKFQHISTNTLLGRDTAGTGVINEIGVGGGLSFNGFDFIQITPNGGGTHAILTTEVAGTVGWRGPANYPCYPIFKSASNDLQFPKISDAVTAGFPGSPVTGQFYYHKDHKCLYVFDSVAGGWLSTHIYELWFGGGNADIAATAYTKFHEVNTFATFTDTLGHLIGADVKVVGLSVVMATSHGSTVTFQVFDDGVGVTGATLSLGASDTKGADETLMSDTIAANSAIGVKVTAGSMKFPARGVIRLRRFST